LIINMLLIYLIYKKPLDRDLEIANEIRGFIN
jgi:hypothetical protein